jgi:hypothetical protein
MAIYFFQSPKNGVYHMFLESLRQGLSKKDVTSKPFMITKKKSVATITIRGVTNFFLSPSNTPPLSNGN